MVQRKCGSIWRTGSLIKLGIVKYMHDSIVCTEHCLRLFQKPFLADYVNDAVTCMLDHGACIVVLMFAGQRSLERKPLTTNRIVAK